jgi:hypothetical protein
MAIETTCQGCQKLLRVGDQHAGKTARCPSCGTIYTVPAHTANSPSEIGGYAYASPTPPGFSSPDSPSKPGERWLVKTAGGLSYGPVPKSELDRWLVEGRITPDSFLQREGNFTWEPADEVYPQLRMPPAKPGASPFAATSYDGKNPFADQFATANPYTSPSGGGAYQWPGRSSLWREPHRGGTVLALAIVGLFFCDILPVIAIIMAIVDLNKMGSGTMDPSGRGLTIAGLVIAILKLLLTAGIIFSIVAGDF